ncbi:MAG: hypothetical protein CML25_01085 [Rhizobiales bacterium]|nr:hypothetical protein [Hyphomicrobiales bacterium]|tara:strand:+ start:278 stop:1180 length:903 start_codon:yes stop_codon:yes gene_type:complete
MKAYKYIFKKSLLSFLGALLIISAIDFAFNFFSEIEDISDDYTYADALSYLIATEPYRMRSFIYLAAVVGFLAVFVDANFLRAFNIVRQAGLNKTKYALMIFTPVILISMASYEFIVPELTNKAQDFRKSKVSSSFKDQPMIIEIQKIDDSNFVMVSEDLSLTFDIEGELSIKDQYSGEFSDLNYNKNIKQLTFSELVENSSASFEKFSLVSKTELMRRSLNFLSYFVIFLIGLEIILSFAKTLNVNRILIYGFGACLIYGFIESVFADSIAVFMLPYYLQAFPILLVMLYYMLRKRYFF